VFRIKGKEDLALREGHITGIRISFEVFFLNFYDIICQDPSTLLSFGLFFVDLLQKKILIRLFTFTCLDLLSLQIGKEGSKVRRCAQTDLGKTQVKLSILPLDGGRNQRAR
jgi:hypothetical protein